MVESKEEQTETPNTTIMVETPQRVSYTNFKEDMANLMIELEVLFVNTEKARKMALLRALDHQSRKILAKLVNPGQRPFNDLIKEMEEEIEKEQSKEKRDEIPAIKELIIH